MTHDLRFPIGEFQWPESASPGDIATWLDDIEIFPADLRRVVTPLNQDQLDTPYRPGGWTVRQVVHHVGDSHLNSMVRFKLALTEDNPTIRPYNEAAWADLADYRATPIPLALEFLEALHTRWLLLLRTLGPSDWKRTLDHPEWDRPLPLDTVAALYSWHGKHHLAHITSLLDREGW